MNVVNNFLSRSWLLLLARITQLGAIFLIFWLYSIRLDKNLYGIYQKIFIINSVFAAVLGLGLPLLIASLGRKQLVSQLISLWHRTRWIYAGALVLVFFVAWRLSFPATGIRWLLPVLSLITAAYMVVEMLLIRREGDKWVFRLNISYTLLFVVLHLWLLYGGAFSLVAWLSGMIGLGATRLLLAIRLFLRVGGREEGVVAEAIPDETDPVYFHQWVFLSLNGVLESFSANIDNLFLAWLLSGAAFAVYFIGSYEIPLTGLLVSVAGTFINVQIRKYYLEDDSILRMFHTVCLIQSFLLFPLFFFLQIHSAVLFDLFFHGKYGESVGIFLISSCILPFRIANYTAILQNKMKGRLIISGSILGMIAKLLLCLLLYRWAGVKGVAAAVVIGTVIQMGYYLYHSAILLGVRIYRVLPLKSLLLYFLASGIISLAEARLSSGLPVLQQLIAGAMTLLLLSGVPFYVYYRKIRRPNG